ncbi:MAG: LLM class flavin-dependent oxidoreductase [Porticoccaceae bacterium]|jgi:alkanesulfonate monooxygenase SsuD/methylene tetrahydromethanopterin reductase-like flavin-dependent oxidoreductase (luciferase family)
MSQSQSSRGNAVGKERQYWGVLPVAPGPQLMEMGKQMEDTGFEGAFMLQIYGPPFAPLAAVASGTSRLKLSPGVAVAASRSPFETAFAAMDMDRISEGRFVLGIGSSLPSTTVGMHGAPNYKLMTHLRDTVGAVRHIVSGAHQGLQPYDGVYYKADYQEMIVTAPPVREHIPIWIGAMRDGMTRLALEVADGLLGHSLWTVQYTNDHIRPLIDRSLSEFNRKREDIEITYWPWVAINNDRQQAIDDSRPTVAYYAGIKSYEDLFEAHGFLKEAKICQEAAVRQSDVASVLDKVPDEMVLAFVACGSIEEVQEQTEPLWSVADAMCPMTPFRCLSNEQLMAYGAGIYQLVAAAKD